MNRSPLRRRQLSNGDRNARRSIRISVYERDDGCVLRGYPAAGDCYGHMTPHHLLKSRHGGLYVPSNLVAACSFHNDWVEDHPNAAHALGLVIRSGETAAVAWDRMRRAGLFVGYEPGMA